MPSASAHTPIRASAGAANRATNERRTGAFYAERPAGGERRFRVTVRYAYQTSSKNWPTSVVPWGAKLRERDEVVEYNDGDGWKRASGPRGKVTDALILFAHRSGFALNRNVAGRQAREMFYDQRTGLLMSEWKKNDFGKWSWNLMRNGHRTVYYIHTTPDDEELSDANVPFELQASHGCRHIRPRDRERMVNAKALRAGAVVQIRPYGERLAR